MEFEIGDKVIVKTSREIKTSIKLIKNDVVLISGKMAKGGYAIIDLRGKYMGTVRQSDIKPY